MKHLIKNLSGRIIGLILIIAAVLAALFYRARQEPEDEPQPIRPIKTFIVGEKTQLPRFYFPGTIDADTGVDLSFEVSGRLVEFPVQRGQVVTKDTVLAQLDDRDFRNKVKDAQAQLDLTESTLSRMENALKLNAVSQEDYSQAKANRDIAKAQLDISKKALDDTQLRARFDGIVSDTYVDNYDTLTAGNPVLKLQDVRVLNLVVSIPESYLVQIDRDVTRKSHYTARFDSIPDRSFDVQLKEFATTADPVTQTYRATYLLIPPDDESVLLLPGMTGTVMVDIPLEVLPTSKDQPLLQVPSDAVGIASDGSFFVWLLQTTDDPKIFTVTQRPVTIGDRAGDSMAVTSGLAAGDRIATAGITILTEGRSVCLFNDTPATVN